MKKICVLLTVVLTFVMVGNVQFVKASGDEYRYDVVWDGSESQRKAWFKNGEEISGNPDVIEEMSQITIATTPDEACAEYLATFYEPTSRVTVEPGVTVTFGSSDNATSIQGLTCYDSEVTIYGEGGEFNEDGSLPGSVYGVTCINSTVYINGNVQYLCLGDEFKFDSVKENNGSVVVSGNVYDIQWHTTSEYTQGDNGTEYYRGFIGDATVSGEVESIYVYEIQHSNVLGTDVKTTIGEGYWLSGFEMTDGVLSEETKAGINEVESDVENFYFEYAPLSDGRWQAIARYPSGAETGFYKDVTDEEVRAILEDGKGRVVLDRDGEARADLSTYNLSELKVYRGGISINDVTADGNGLLMVHSYGREFINVNVNGDVDRLQINFTRSNENMNINVNGNVKNGEVYKFSLQSDFPIYLGKFTCTDMEIYKDGVWNPDLFLSLGTTEYHPVDDAVLDDALGLEKEIQNGSETISEMADMLIEEVESDTLNELEDNNSFNACIDEYEDAKVLTGVEIELQKFDYNETTGEVSNREVVTELGNKDLGITVKVPKDKFKEGKEYIIVREHDNNGVKEMDVLVPRRDGDKLTFKTNKFSSFIIVEVGDSVLNGLCEAEDGNFYYYVNGQVDTTYTGMAENEYGVWYVKNGAVNKNYTGMYLYDGKWIYVNAGKYDTEYTGMAKNSAGWWYMKNGVLDRTYTGMSKNQYGVWYMKAGKLDTTYTGMILYDGKWIYVNAGKYDTKYTGMAKNSAGIWYMKNGVLDRTYTGMYVYEGKWVYINKGKYDTAYTGMAKNSAGWWYMKNGVLDRTYTGMSKNQYGVWYMKAGKLDRSFTGMCLYNGKWVYVNSGKYDTTYTGIAKNSAGWWYMKNGVLDRTYTGKVTYQGNTYNVIKGKVAK